MRRLAPLAASFVALLGLVVWREAGRGGTTSLQQEANLHPFATRPFVADDVAKVEVTAPGDTKPAYTLVREDKSWRVLGDFKAPASGAAVTKLLDALAKSEGEFRTDDKSVLEQFDLTPKSEVAVRVIDKDGKDLVHVGLGRTSGAQGAFVRDLAADDSKTYVVVNDVRSLFGLGRTSTGAHEAEKPKPDAFHDKEFPHFPLDKTKKVDLASPGRVVSFEKNEKGEWKVASGGPDVSMKKDGVESAIRSLSGGMHPSALVDPAKRKELGFDAPKYRISVSGDDGIAHVAVGATDEKLEHFYVRLDVQQDPDVLYEASDYEFHQLFPIGATLFDLPKIDTTKDAPTRVVVERKGKETIELTRKGTKSSDDWTLVSPKWPLETRQSSLRALASSLSSVHLTDYVDDPNMPEADTTVRFGAAGAPDDQLKVFAVDGKAPAGKDRLATMPGHAGRVYVVAESSVDRLAGEPFALFETKLLRGWTKDDVTAIRVAGGASLKKSGDEWKLVGDGSAESPAEKSAADAWLDKLFALDLTGVASDGKDEGLVSVTIERTSGAPLVFELSSVKDGKRTVKIGDFRGLVADAPGLLPDAASLAPKKTDGNK